MFATFKCIQGFPFRRRAGSNGQSATEATPGCHFPKPRALPPSAQAQANFGVVVCSLEEVPLHHEAQITDMLTCLGPEHPVIRPNWPGLQNHMILRFHDVETPSDEFICPTEEHVGQILRFGRNALRRCGKGERVRLLAHCAAGISRSAAAALLILAVHYGKGREPHAVRHLYSIRPQARPNATIVSLGDKLLQRQGILLRSALAFRQQMTQQEMYA